MFGYIFIGIVISIVAMFLIGLTLYDIRIVEIEKQRKKHPHAKQWRQRPVLIIDALPDAIRTIKKHYRNSYSINSAQVTNDTLLLTLPDRATVDKHSLLQAIRYLDIHPQLTSLAVVSSPKHPKTLGEFLHLYRLSIATIIARARTGIGGGMASSSPLPILTRQASTPPRTSARIWSYLYRTASYLATVTVPCILTYALYLAIIPHQLELLAICTAVFCLFVSIAIWSYEQLMLVNKLSYTLLIPATLIYFAVLAVWRPLKTLADMAKAKFPIGVGLFVRVKDILRVV